VSAPFFQERGPLALVCGAGQFPLAVADAVTASGRSIYLIGIRGAADRAIARYPHGWIGMGRLGRMLKLAREAGAHDIAFVGAVPRPAASLDFIPDLRFLKLMLRYLGGGDNDMLTHFADDVERDGFKVRGVHEIAPGLILPAGVIGRHTPSPEAEAAAQLGMNVLNVLGPYDIGQGAVVADRRVVAIEAAEGTDGMLDRVSALRAAGRLKIAESKSVFVKAAKRGQDLRLDTPAIGLATIEKVKAAGLAGIAVASGQVMTPDLGALIEAADKAGLFIFGAEPEA
jgi:UDP-2,3-diacylglucosamine hydrolase